MPKCTENRKRRLRRRRKEHARLQNRHNRILQKARNCAAALSALYDYYNFETTITAKITYWNEKLFEEIFRRFGVPPDVVWDKDASYAMSTFATSLK